MINNNDDNMLTMAEMDRITGVRRQTLQEYEKIGLLMPINEAEIINTREKNCIRKKDDKQKRSSKWKFTKEDRYTVEMIQLFRMVGYTYKEIKSILKSNNIDNELRNAQVKIDEKIADLTEKKNYLTFLFEAETVINDFPQILKDYYWHKFTKWLSSSDYFIPLSMKIKTVSEMISDNKTDNYIAENNLWIKYTILFQMLLSMKSEPEDSEYLKVCWTVFIQLINNLFLEDENESDEVKAYVSIKTLTYVLLCVNNEEDFVEIIDIYGTDSIDFLFQKCNSHILELRNNNPDKTDDFNENDEIFEEIIKKIN